MLCRARLKQRLEAAQEGVSTEDGSSSVTSGLDEDQALQADMMMRRLVQVNFFCVCQQCALIMASYINCDVPLCCTLTVALGIIQSVQQLQSHVCLMSSIVL